MATADLLVLVLRVLPGKLREGLNAERDLPVRREERPDTSGSARENPGSGQTRSPGGTFAFS
jgi:hypothetical protein